MKHMKREKKKSDSSGFRDTTITPHRSENDDVQTTLEN